MIYSIFQFLLLVFIASVCVFYHRLILQIAVFWRDRSKNENHVAIEKIFSTKFVVIIPVRNEEENIRECIASILKQNYPHDFYRIIVVDDHSTDNTVSIIRSIAEKRLTVLTLPVGLSGKKLAIKFAVQFIDEAETVLFLTDGDCVWSPQVLMEHAASYEENSQIKMVAGQIFINKKPRFISYFQSMDMLATMALTYWAGETDRFYLANGAHISIRKEFFIELDPYVGNIHLPSGDDVFIAKKVFEYRINQNIRHKIIKYLFPSQNGIIWTDPMLSWKDLLSQRKRWASKTAAYANKSILYTKSVIFLQSFVIVFLPLIFIIYPDLTYLSYVWLIALIAKITVDYNFLKTVSKNFHQDISFNLRYLKASLLYCLYFLYMAVMAVLSPSFEWKGRLHK